MSNGTSRANLANDVGAIGANAPMFSSYATPALRTAVTNGILLAKTVSASVPLRFETMDGTLVDASNRTLGAAGGATAPRVINLALSNTVGGWSTTDAIIVTARNHRNELVTFARFPTTANGNETLLLGLVQQIISVEVPKQPLGTGTITLGADTGAAVRPTRQILLAAAGVVEFMFEDDDAYTNLTIAAGQVGRTENWSIKAIGPNHAAAIRLFR